MHCIMNVVRLLSLCIALVLGSVASQCAAQTAYPMLMSLRPIAVQVGTTAELTVSSRYTMAGAYQVLISGQGVSAEVVPSEKKPEDVAKKTPTEKIKIKVTATANALPGVRDVRIATPQGVSTVGQLVIVRDPVNAEGSGNDTPAKAQPITVPAAIC